MSSSPTPTRACPLYHGRESGRHVGSAQGWTPTALLEHPGRDSSRGGPGSSGGPEDNLLRLGRPLPGRLPTGQPQFPPPPPLSHPCTRPSHIRAHTPVYLRPPHTQHSCAHSAPHPPPSSAPQGQMCKWLTGGSNGQLQQDAVAGQGCGGRMRFQTLLSWGAAGEGPSPRPRLPLLPGRCRLEEASTASAAAAPPPTRARRSCAAPPTCHWLRHAHRIQPRHTSHTHTIHTLHTHIHTPHTHHRTAGGAGRGQTPWPASYPGDVQAPRHHLVGRAVLPPLVRLVQAQLGWAPTRPEGLLLTARRPKPRLSAFGGQACGSW